MHYFEHWGDHWHHFPLAMCLFMFIMMAIFIFILYKRRGSFITSRWFRQNWGRNWFADCYRYRTGESASEILKRRYVDGEINKEEFEQKRRDISDKVQAK